MIISVVSVFMYNVATFADMLATLLKESKNTCIYLTHFCSKKKQKQKQTTTFYSSFKQT